MAFLVCLFGQAGVLSAEEPVPYQYQRGGNLFVSAVILPMDHESFMKIWDTPRTSGFGFDLTDKIDVGHSITAIIMFSGAAEKDGKVRLHCLTDVVFPDGGKQEVFDGLCVDGKLAGPSTDYTLAGNQASFKAPGNLAGQLLVIEQTVTDEISGTTIPLRVSVKIMAPGGES